MAGRADPASRPSEGVAEIEAAKRIGGRLCLDFVNTVGGRIRRSGGSQRDYEERVIGERLVSYAALLRWGVLAGAIGSPDGQALARVAAERPAAAAAVLRHAIELREAVYCLFRTTVEKRKADARDLATVNRELRRARRWQELVAAPAFALEWRTGRALDRVLWPVVLDAGELLTQSELNRLRQCPGDECGWLFLDTSKSGRRRWCDMADCGNLAKVRRFRRRVARSSG